jgi:predicted alpha/beta hydrolase
MQELHVPATDGRALAATLYLPQGEPDLAVQINPGMAIERGFYRRFATWLAERGCAVLTYDNRGVGGSLRGLSGRHDSYLVSEWGAFDQAGVTDYLRRHCPAAPFVVVSHSIGAQIMGFSPRLREARAVFTVSAQFFGWTHKNWRGRMEIWFDGLVTLPRAERRGYHAYAFMNGFELPRPAVAEFRRWSLSRHFFCDESSRPLRPHYADLRAPVWHLVFTDDELIRRRQQAAGLVELYPNARARFDFPVPRDWGVDEVGHFGFFRKTMPEAAWLRVLDWLRENAKAGEPALA